MGHTYYMWKDMNLSNTIIFLFISVHSVITGMFILDKKIYTYQKRSVEDNSFTAIWSVLILISSKLF